MEENTINALDLTYNIIMLTGLPGSGKSMYAYTHYPVNYYTHHIDCDQYMNDDKTYNIDRIIKSIPNMVLRMNSNEFYQSLGKRECNLVIDGYIPSKEFRMKLITAIINHIGDTVYPVYRIGHVDFTFQEIYWIPNPDACMNNDRYRVFRYKNSIISIRNGILDEPLDTKPIEVLFKDKLSQPIRTFEPLRFEVKKYNTTDGLFNAALIRYRDKDNNRMDKKDDGNVYGPWFRVNDFMQSKIIEAFDNILLALYPSITYISYMKILRDTNIRYEEKEIKDIKIQQTPFKIMRYVFNIEDMKKAIQKACLEIPEEL